MAPRCRDVDSESLLRPTPNDLALAPGLGVLAVLDATLTIAAYQIQSEHPELGLDALARGDLPSAPARTAALLVFRCADLRAAIRDYHALVLNPDLGDDQLH